MCVLLRARAVPSGDGPGFPHGAPRVRVCVVCARGSFAQRRSPYVTALLTPKALGGGDGGRNRRHRILGGSRTGDSGVADVLVRLRE